LRSSSSFQTPTPTGLPTISRLSNLYGKHRAVGVREVAQASIPGMKIARSLNGRAILRPSGLMQNFLEGFMDFFVFVSAQGTC
jgi:hypothetical protein